MKRLLILLLLFPAILQAQNTYPIRGINRTVYSADTMDIKFSSDSTKFVTNNKAFVFNKTVKINKDTAATRAYARSVGSGGGVTPTSSFLYWNSITNTYEPYADSTGTGNKGGIYIGEQDPTSLYYVNYNQQANFSYLRAVNGLFVNTYIAFNPLIGNINGANLVVIDSENELTYGNASLLKISNGGTPKATIDKDGIIHAQMPHVALYRNTDLTISATQNVWYKFTGMTAKDDDFVTYQGDSVRLDHAGSYLVTMTVSFTGLNNEIWEAGVFKNSVLEEPSQLRYTGTSDVGNMSCPVYVYSDGDDWISFKIRNTTDGDDPTIKRISIVISPMHLDL